MLRNKSDALQVFKNYKHKLENLIDKRIKKLRTNNSKEHMPKKFSNFLREEGITRQLSIEYTSTKRRSGTNQSYACGNG